MRTKRCPEITELSGSRRRVLQGALCHMLQTSGIYTLESYREIDSVGFAFGQSLSYQLYLATDSKGKKTAYSPPPQRSITFPNSATSWGPSVQMQKPMGGISYSKHDTVEIWNLGWQKFQAMKQCVCIMTLSTQGKGSLKMDFFLFTGCVKVWKLSREKHSTLKHTSMKTAKIPPRVQQTSLKSPSLLPPYPLLSLLVPVEFMLKTVWFHSVVFGALLYNNINKHIETCGRVKHHTGQCPNRLKINLASP